MAKFPFPTSSLKCAMSVAALPGGVLGARNRLKPLPLSLVGWCANCNFIKGPNIFKVSYREWKTVPQSSSALGETAFQILGTRQWGFNVNLRTSWIIFTFLNFLPFIILYVSVEFCSFLFISRRIYYLRYKIPNHKMCLNASPALV